MKSPLIQEIYEEGKLEGTQERQREILLMQLRAKFGNLPRSVYARIQRMRSENTLNRLFKPIVTANSLEELGFK